MLERIRKSLEEGNIEFTGTAIKYLIGEIDKLRKANIIRIAGWKGKSGIGLMRNTINQTYTTIEYRQDKHSGDVKEIKHEIPMANVEFIKDILKMFDKKRITYREIVTILIKKKGFQVTYGSFNGGGHNRTEYYFPYYYYPLKILEHDKLIHYSGRGVVKR